MSSWTRFRFRNPQRLLAHPQHDETHLPVALPSRSGADSQIVTEFRSKLKMAEDLISKLAFSLREIQDMRRTPKNKRARATNAKVVGHIGGPAALGKSESK